MEEGERKFLLMKTASGEDDGNRETEKQYRSRVWCVCVCVLYECMTVCVCV